MSEELLKIINHYGLTPQLKQLSEEVYELIEAILLDVDDEESLEHIKEEIADVIVMVEQFRLYYDIDISEIKEIGRNKIKRQLGRISKEE